MTTKQILYSLGVLVVLALFFAGLASFTTPPVVAPTAGDKSDILGGTLGSSGDYQYSEDKPYYKITATYPASTGLAPAADAAARATIEQGLAQEIAKFKQDSNLDALTAEDAQIQNISGDHKYTLDMQYKAYTSSTTVSYAYQVYADTLGAHPNGYYLTFVFGQDGARITSISQLHPANPKWLEHVSALVTKDVTAQMQKLTAQADVHMDLYPEGLAAKEENFSNFVLDGNDIVILIPPYQVAAYAAGSFEVRIPLADISH